MNDQESKQFQDDFKRTYGKEWSDDLSAFISYCNGIKLDSLKHLILEFSTKIEKFKS